MTVFLDTHIPIDPRMPDAINPGIVYLSHIAWPHRRDQQRRERLVSALLSAVYKQAGRHLPSDLAKVKREKIAATVDMALHRIATRRVPAARMVLHRWLRGGLIAIERAGLTADQEERLATLMRTGAAAALVNPDGNLLGTGEAILPDRRLDDIQQRIWEDSRPALAMMMALPLQWAHPSERRTVASLLFDPTWVRDAVWNARALALLIERTIEPPELLVPRRRPIRGTVRHLMVRPYALAGLLTTRVAGAPQIAPALPRPARTKSS